MRTSFSRQIRRGEGLRLGLVLLASEAYLAQAQYLFEGGWSAGARVATASAARCLRAAGTVG